MSAGGSGSNGSYWKLDVAALVVAIIALIVAGFAAYQNLRQANESKRQSDIALESFNNSLMAAAKMNADKELFDWQVLTVHAIINRHSSPSEFGLSLDDIKKEFIDKAAQKKPPLSADALQDEALDKVLIHLRSTAQIHRLHDGKYVTNMLEPTFGFGRTLILNEAGEEMISFLASHGPSDAQAIRNSVERFKLSNSEFFFTLSSYVKDGLITVNKDKKFESILDSTQFDKRQ